MPDYFGAAASILGTGINNILAGARTREDREQNYLYGEMAADNADRRTRALYNDFYSPGALMQQYKEAGLSPSMMFGGTPGQGGLSGARGTGAAGMQTPFMPISLVEAAQAAQLFAQTKKTNAETKNIEKDTTLKALEEDLKVMDNYIKEQDFYLTTSNFITSDNKSISLFEIANNSKDYEDFIDKVRKTAANEGVKDYSYTENGQKTLRKIWLDSNRYDRDIEVLSAEGVSASFAKSITQALKKEGFIEQNATTAVKQLKAAAETADLTTEQKGAWNDLIERLGKKSETAKDIVIVLGMILANYAANANVKIQTGDSYFVKNDK